MKIKEILVMHHSHMDVGYTHSQPIIEELQKDFIDQALDLFDATSDWDENSKPRWTCEVTWQVKQWLKRSNDEDVERFIKYVKEKRIAIGAMEHNNTPLGSAEELVNSLNKLDFFRSLTGDSIKVAYQHDVTGVPWSITDLLLDSGVELLVMGINLHTSNDGPGDRPNVFRWETPSGREIIVMNAHHYTSFDQILKVDKLSTEIMQASLDQYVDNILTPRNYPHDFLFLSSTNFPVMYDNGQPNIITAELVKKWNSEGREPLIRYVTPEMLLEKIKSLPLDTYETHRGDWTDFWNHGATSTAWETALNSKARSRLKTAEMLSTINGINHRQEKLYDEVWEQIKLYDEHTWTSADSSYFNEECRIQSNIKAGRAIRAHELAGYTLMDELEKITKNECSYIGQSGMLAVNPTNQEIHQFCRIPKAWTQNKIMGRVASFRHVFSNFTSAKTVPKDKEYYFIEMTVPPFSWMKIPLSKAITSRCLPELKTGSEEQEVNIRALDNDKAAKRFVGSRYIESPYHKLTYDMKSGRITGLKDLLTGWEVIPEDADYDFFELIHEEPEKRFDGTRKSFYDRDVAAETRFETCWARNWRASRTGISGLESIEVINEDSSICLKRCLMLKGMDKVEHRIRLFVDRPWIEVQIDFYRQANTEPEAVYCVTQLNLPEGWRSHFDTGGIPVELDAEQLDGCSHGWVTTNTFAAMHSNKNCAVIYNAEAPLIQIGDFNFANITNNIERKENPLMLAWSLDNYWETNFPLAQPGKISLKYGFQSFGGYDDAIVSKQAEAYTHGLSVHVMQNCPEKSSDTIVEVDNPKVKIEYIKNDSSGNNILLRLINLSGSHETANIKWNLFELGQVQLVSPQEKVIKTLEKISPREFRIELDSKRIVSVLLSQPK